MQTDLLKVGDYVRPSNPKHPRHHVTFEVCSVREVPPLAPVPSKPGWPGHPGHDGYTMVSASSISPYGCHVPLHMTPEGWELVRAAEQEPAL